MSATRPAGAPVRGSCPVLLAGAVAGCDVAGWVVVEDAGDVDAAGAVVAAGLVAGLCFLCGALGAVSGS